MVMLMNAGAHSLIPNGAFEILVAKSRQKDDVVIGYRLIHSSLHDIVLRASTDNPIKGTIPTNHQCKDGGKLVHAFYPKSAFYDHPELHFIKATTQPSSTAKTLGLFLGSNGVLMYAYMDPCVPNDSDSIYTSV